MKKIIDKNELLKDLYNKKTIIPNLLSLSRCAAPFVILPLAFAGNPVGTLMAVAGFAFTDFLDGKIARKLNCESELGSLLDAISDKVFSLGLLIPLCFTNALLLIPLALEGVIAGINSKSFLKGNNPKTVFKGKVKIWILSGVIVSQCMGVATGNFIFNILTLVGTLGAGALQLDNIKEYYTNDKCKDLENCSFVDDFSDDVHFDSKEKELSRNEIIRLLKEERENLTAAPKKEKAKQYTKKKWF